MTRAPAPNAGSPKQIPVRNANVRAVGLTIKPSNPSTPTGRHPRNEGASTPFDIDTLEPIDPPWPAIREWIPADDTDPQAVFP